MTKEMRLINEIGQWAEKNFAPYHYPSMGIVEEIGEAAHAELKRFQKIRGFHSEAKFADNFTDALGDATVYLLHWCYLNNAFVNFEDLRLMGHKEALLQFELVMQHLLQATSSLFSTSIVIPEVASQVAQRILQGLTYWACKYDYDLRLIVETTWLSVKDRDWKKNAETGRHS